MDRTSYPVTNRSVCAEYPHAIGIDRTTSLSPDSSLSMQTIIIIIIICLVPIFTHREVTSSRVKLLSNKLNAMAGCQDSVPLLLVVASPDAIINK